MAYHYSFGIEIEMVAKPRHAQTPLDTQEYYRKFANALTVHGVPARAADLSGPYRHLPEEYNARWYITRDRSISDTASTIALEAVSRVLSTRRGWEDEIDKFWHAQTQVFHMPEKAKECGSHVHVSPGTHQRWTDEQLRDIAVGVARYETYVQEMLPPSRRGNQYCLKNTASSSRLKECCSQSNWDDLLSMVRRSSTTELINLMQTDRKVLFNMQPAAANRIGTIEFRGGRHLRGPWRTKRWIAFAVSFIHFLVQAKSCTLGYLPLIFSTRDLYSKILRSAEELDLRRHLPEDYSVLNETKRQAPQVTRDRPTFPFTAPYVYPPTPPPAYTGHTRRDTEAARPEPTYTPRYTSSHSPSRLRHLDNDEEDIGPLTFAYGLLRILQVILGLTVVGVYGHAIDIAATGAGPTLGFAEFVAVVSILTAAASIALVLYNFRSDESPMVLKWQWAFEGFSSYVLKLSPFERSPKADTLSHQASCG